MSKRALITGGAGFIGSHVAERFLDAGYAVEIIDNLSSGKRVNLPAAATFHELDITSADAARVIHEGGFDAICHLAAQIDVRKSVADPAYDAGVNIGGSLNLLEAVRASGRKTRFVFSSTGGAIYGDFVPLPSFESMPKDPESPYGIAKLSVEYYMGYFARVHGLDTVALRYSNVYGPRQDPHGEAGVVAIFCKRIRDGEALTVFGEGGQTRDYVYAGDVAHANFLAAEVPLPKMAQVDTKSFNIGTGIETTVIQLSEIIGQAAGKPVKVNTSPARPGEVQRSSVDISKARDVLGWTPQVALTDGLKATYDFFAGQK
ncbi:MAG: GDP-mannose 4,6-dehydratase [Cytophagaceae bacterium]|nr:GDP-mannose 4,6-dehydratase [Gemmatimonadaceae bacterium]